MSPLQKHAETEMEMSELEVCHNRTNSTKRLNDDCTDTITSNTCPIEAKRGRLVTDSDALDFQETCDMEKPVSNEISEKDVDSKMSSSEMESSLYTLADGLSCLHDENIELHTLVQKLRCQMTEQQKQIGNLKISIEEVSHLIDATQLNNQLIQNQIQSIKESMRNLNNQIANDGTFIWKITNVAEKMSRNIDEMQTSIYSPPFFSSPYGYKMCLRLYFNGDGQARGTHLSLFFVLLRGENDAILQWPFSFKVTFCLMDQSGEQKHIIDSFRPDIRSTSFHRPRLDMNTASGIPKFCPLSIIQQHNNPYICDDCMFIQCIVDFKALPKSLTSYICTINPGLPKAIQSKMIEEEVKRCNLSAVAPQKSTDSAANSDKSEKSS